MRKHIRIACPQVCKFVVVKTRHLIDHGTFQMHYLIMRQYQNELLRERIGHGECHLVVVIASEIRVELHIIKKIMHPAHIPFQAEAKTAVLWLACHLRPRRRFLSDHHYARISSADDAVQMTEKLDRLQIFVFSVFIRHPLSIRASVIQIQHRSHSVYAQTVDVEMLHPVKRVCN